MSDQGAARAALLSVPPPLQEVPSPAGASSDVVAKPKEVLTAAEVAALADIAVGIIAQAVETWRPKYPVTEKERAALARAVELLTKKYPAEWLLKYLPELMGGYALLQIALPRWKHAAPPEPAKPAEKGSQDAAGRTDAPPRSDGLGQVNRPREIVVPG